MIRIIRTWRLKHLLKSRDFNIRKNAAYELGKLKYAHAIKELIDALKPDMGKWNDSAAWALGEIGDTCATMPLISTIRSNPPAPMMNSVILALGKIGDKEAVQPIMELIEHSPKYNKVGIETLKKINSNVVSLLIEKQLMKLTQSNSYLIERTDAADKLKLLDWVPKNPQEMTYFLISLNNWKEAVAIGVDAVQPIVNIYYKGDKNEEKNEIVKKSALQALSLIRDPNATIFLISLLNNGHFSYSAIKALSAIAKQDRSNVIEQLILALSSENIEIRPEAAKMLTTLGWIPDTDELYAKFAVAQIPWNRKLILSAGNHCVKLLTPFLMNPQLSKRAVELLNELNWQPSSVEESILCFIALEDVESIAKFGNSALDYLITRLNFDTIDWISEALVQIGNDRAIEPLAKLMEGITFDFDDFDFKHHREHMRIAMNAIARIGGSGAVQVLFRLAQNKYIASYATNSLELLLSQKAESVSDFWLHELANIEELTEIKSTGQSEYSDYYQNYINIYKEVPIMVDKLRTLAKSELDNRNLKPKLEQ